MLWFWIIAYDLWTSPTCTTVFPITHSMPEQPFLFLVQIPAFLIRTGAWLQHRAQTLAIWCMFAMTFPAFIDNINVLPLVISQRNSFMGCQQPCSGFQYAVFIYHVYKIVKFKRNPLKEEIYTDLPAYQAVAAKWKETNMIEQTKPSGSDSDANFLGWKETVFGDIYPTFNITVAIIQCISLQWVKRLYADYTCGFREFSLHIRRQNRLPGII